MPKKEKKKTFNHTCNQTNGSQNSMENPSRPIKMTIFKETKALKNIHFVCSLIHSC